MNGNRDIMTRGQLASSSKLLSNDDNLTSDDIEMYSKIQQELRFLDQQTKFHEGFNTVVMKNQVIRIFESIRIRNCQISELSRDIDTLKSQLNDKDDQNKHLQIKLADQFKHINTLIEENEEFNQTADQTIKEKNKEVQILKDTIQNLNKS